MSAASTSTSGFRLLIGSDSAGAQYKAAIAKDLEADSRVASVHDVNITSHLAESCSYAEVGVTAGRALAAGHADRAILICGTGIGMAISANKVPGVLATTAHDSYSVERSILSNNCQVLALGQRVIGLELARRLVREWLGYHFDPQSHSFANIAAIAAWENRSSEKLNLDPAGSADGKYPTG